MLINVHTHSLKNEGIEILNLGDLQSTSEFYSFGFHPWSADPSKLDVEKLTKKLLNENCVAVGEIGLDKLKGSSIAIQTEVFISQIEISESIEKPVIIHCVRAWNELKVLKRRLKPKQNWIFHGFNSSKIVTEVIKEGLYISIGSSILNNERLQSILKDIPSDKLFLETDNSEELILSIYKKVSELKGITLSELERIIEGNFRKVFKQ